MHKKYSQMKLNFLSGGKYPPDKLRIYYLFMVGELKNLAGDGGRIFIIKLRILLFSQIGKILNN